MNQYFQISPQMRDAIFGNIGTIVSFRIRRIAERIRHAEAFAAVLRRKL